MNKDNLELIGQYPINTSYGLFEHYGYRFGRKKETVICLVRQVNNKKRDVPLVRIQYGCIHGSVFSSIDCDCNYQIMMSLRLIAESGNGAFIYFPDYEGMGIGLQNKIRLVEFEIKEGLPPKKAASNIGIKIPDHEPLNVICNVLKESGIGLRIALISSNFDKINKLRKYGVEITEIVSISVPNEILSEIAIMELDEKYKA